MNASLAIYLYVSVMGCTLWLFLLGAARIFTGAPRPWLKALLGVSAAFALFIPVGDQPLWNRAFSFYPNPSLPSIGVVIIALWQLLSGRALFKAADWHATWVFGALAGSLLYLHQLIFDRLDLYYWGWSRDGALVVIASAAIVLVAFGNRLGLLLLTALIAYALNAIESHNAWDYVMDPIYWVFSMGAIVRQCVIRLLRRRKATLQARFAESGPTRPKGDNAFAFMPPPQPAHRRHDPATRL